MPRKMSPQAQEIKNPRLLEIIEAFDQDIGALAKENRRLRKELRMSLDGPLESSSEEEDNQALDQDDLSVGRSPSSKRSTSKRRPGATTFEVTNKLIYSYTDKATATAMPMYKATLLQELRHLREGTALDYNARGRRSSMWVKFVRFYDSLQLPMSPNANERLVWDISGLVLILYDLFAIPFHQAFTPPEDSFSVFMGWLTLIFWTLDMVMSNLVGYFEGPELIMVQKLITKRYLKSWFILDCIVVLPDWFTRLVTVSEGTGFSSVGRILRSARAVRVVRLLRLLKLQKLLNKVYDYIDSEYTFIAIDMLRLVFLIIVLNHVIACLWFWMGMIGYEAGDKNWLEHTGMDKVIEGSITYRYTTALHWSLTQFTPAGMDVYARNLPERIFSNLVLVFAIMTFSSILASVSSSMTALRNLQGDTKKQFWLLRRYLRFKKVTRSTRVRLLKYLEHQTVIQARTVKQADVHLLPQLSGPLSALLSYELNKTHVVNHPLLKHADEVFQAVLVKVCHQGLKIVHYAGDDDIFSSGDIGESMFFLKAGEMIYAAISGIRKEDFELGDWLAEAVLWTTWSHRGKLSGLKPTEMVLLSPDVFINLMGVSKLSYEFCRTYAAKFVELLNMSGEKKLSDLSPDLYVLESMIEISAEKAEDTHN